MGLDDGSMKMGRPAVAHYNNMKNDTTLESAKELRTAMLDRETWKGRALARPCSSSSSSSSIHCSLKGSTFIVLVSAGPILRENSCQPPTRANLGELSFHTFVYNT